MAEDGKISTSEILEDDGTLEDIIAQLEEMIGLVNKLNGEIKKGDSGKWLAGLDKDGQEAKLAIAAVTSMVEKLISVSQNLIAVRQESSKEIARMEAIVKSENRELQREAEINTKVAGSYARLKLELKQLEEQWMNTTDASKKAQIAGDMTKITSQIILQNKQLKDLINSQAKLNAMRTAASTYRGTNKSLLEEIALNKELASIVEKTEAARAKAAAAATNEYKEQIQAEKELKMARLEAVSGQSVSADSLDALNVKVKELNLSYTQAKALYEQVELAVSDLQGAQDGQNDTLDEASKILETLAGNLENYERKMGITSSRMSLRQRQWDGLTNSIYQITRELPNLAVRADTFFLAISNNIPIFIEEFARARKEIGSFRATFLKTLKSFAIGSVLGIALLVLSRFSDIIKVFDKLFNTLEDGTLKTGAFYRQLADHVKNATSSVVKQIYNVRALSREWQKLDTLEQRTEFLSKYRKELDETGLSIKNVGDSEDAFSKNTNLIIEAFIERAKAAAAAALAEENYKVAVEKAIDAEAKASKRISKARGEDVEVTESQLRRDFAKRYGVTDRAMIATGRFQLSKSQLGSVLEDLAKAFGISGITDPNVKQTANKDINALLKLYHSLGDGELATINKDIAEWVEVVAETGKKSKDVRRSLENMVKAFNKGDQAADKYEEYLSYSADAMNKAGVALSDLTKKLNDFGLKTLKDLNDSIAALMNNRSYARGGVTTQRPTFDIVDGKLVQSEESTTVKSSFDKQILTESQNLQEAIKGHQNTIDELNQMWYKASQEEKILITSYIEREEQAMANGVQALSDTIQQTQLEENSALAGLYADNLRNRLDAVKEGSDEEIELRKRLIRATMAAEIAENATLEPLLQKSVSAIRAKYRLEEERAEREWIVKRNEWRKQELENENEYLNKYTSMYVSNLVALERIAMQTELAENAELIENGLISREAIIDKYTKRINDIYDEHRSELLSSEKSFWNLMGEFATDGSAEQLTAQLKQYDIELENEKLQYKELIEVMPAYGKMLEQLYAKRKRLAVGKYSQSQFDKLQDIQSVIFGMRPQIGEQAQARFDLQQEWDRYSMQLELFDNGQLDLTNDELDAIYHNLARIGLEMERLSGFQGTNARVAEHGLLGLLTLPDKDPRTGKSTGKWTDLSADQYDAAESALSSIKDSVDSVVESYVALAQAAYDAAQAQVDAAKTAYEYELEARANGYANDVEGAKRELQLERSKAKQKEQLLRSAQKAQERINTATQVSDLVTASASILKAFAAYPILAGAMITSMWGMFGMAKIKAAQVANVSSTYGDGGYELAVGGSHASGNDIKTGIRTTKGRQMVIEGGEGVGVFSRRAVTKYGDIIPSLVDSINQGDFDSVSVDSVLGQTRYAKEVLAMQQVANAVDLSTVEGLLSVIVSQYGSKSVVLGDGSVLEKRGNTTKITRRN